MTAAIAVLSCAAAQAAPVAGEVLPLRQPDGATIQVRIWGDEFYTVVESLDGYTLIRDPQTGYVCYAGLSDDGDTLWSTGVALAPTKPEGLDLAPHIRINPEAAAAQARAARADFEKRRHEGPYAPRDGGGQPRGPTQGNVQGICLIVDFSDDVGTIAPATVSSYCNQVGFTGFGNNGSVRDYFYDVSDHHLIYTNFVPTAYYRALYPKTYYIDPAIAYGTRARELIIEALTSLETQGFDFSQYDADGNGVIDALNCFYAGYSNSAWATGLWPHAWTVSFCADGVCTGSYQITDMQASLRLRTFCHENGHMLCGFPDLYDYDYDSYGVGNFCLMAYGASNTNPCEPCAYMKYTAGWTNTTILGAPRTGLPATATVNTIYKFPHPTLANEYYLIENRRRIGRDIALPDDGLAIWHIDTNGSNNNQQQTPESHYLVTLVQADGRWDLEHDANSGDSTDLYAAPTYTQCTSLTNPSTYWWSGEQSGLYVTNISLVATTMTFDFRAEVDCNGNSVVDYQDISTGTSGDCNANGIPDECDIARLASSDCTANGIPDECEPDCNGNDVADSCELSAAQGLVGQYYDNQDFTGSRVLRTDSTVNFNWGTGAPITGIGADTFSVRWTGFVRTTTATGSYTFYIKTDDGVRLWVNGQLLVDKWVNQSGVEWSATISLGANQDYPLLVQYYENTGSALAELRWRPPGGSKVIIPASNLRPGLDANQNGVPDECEPIPGDLNCADGQVNLNDVPAFVQALLDPAGYAAAHPGCDILAGDFDGNEVVNGSDIQGFTSALIGP